VMQDLGTLGTGTDAWAMAINENGQVIGISYTNSTPNQVSTPCAYAPNVFMPTVDPFLWENGTMTDLGSLGGTCGFPTWINDRGEVVGQSDLPGDQNSDAFLWTKERGMQDLGSMEGRYPYLIMINDVGVAVGGATMSNNNNNQMDAVLWDGTWHDLGNIDGCAVAFWINSHGQVVGNTGNNCMGPGFLWENEGPMVDLNALVSVNSSGLTVGNAWQINENGEIAGNGYNSVGNHFAVLLIPCDANHPDIEGCDYSLVDASSAPHPAIAPK